MGRIFKSRAMQLSSYSQGASWLSAAQLMFQNLFIPPICIHCQEKRWGRTPLCLSCLKSLNPLREPLTEKSGQDISEANPCHQKAAFGEFPFTLAKFLFPMSPGLSTLVHGFKYRHFRRHIPFLCSFLRYRPDLVHFFSGCDGLVPVPIHSIRQRERGYNQSEVIAQVVSARTGIPVFNHALIRTRYTESQTKLAKQARGENLQLAFKCLRAESLVGKRIVLIDDVFTTGATASHCSSLLLNAGVKRVDVFALAKVESMQFQDDFSQDLANYSSFLG